MSTALAPLWEISEELTALLDSVDTCPDELQPELQARIDAYMGQEVAKVDQIAHVLAAIEWEQKCCDDEIQRLRARKETSILNQMRLEKYVLRIIQSRGVKKLSGRTNTLSVRPSDAVVITDAEEVPTDFKVASAKMPMQSWEALMYVWINFGPDDAKRFNADESFSLSAIKKAIKSGEEVPGADLSFNDNLVRR